MGAHGCVHPAEHQAARGTLANVLEPPWCRGCTMVCGQVSGRPLCPWNFTIKWSPKQCCLGLLSLFRKTNWTVLSSFFEWIKKLLPAPSFPPSCPILTCLRSDEVWIYNSYHSMCKDWTSPPWLTLSLCQYGSAWHLFHGMCCPAGGPLALSLLYLPPRKGIPSISKLMQEIWMCGGRKDTGRDGYIQGVLSWEDIRLRTSNENVPCSQSFA